MIALGWISETAALPPGFVTHRAQHWQVLALPGKPSDPARARLAAQVRAFEHGVPFLPVPPGHPCALAEAVDIADQNAGTIACGLRHLAGLGQLTLSVSWERVETPWCRTGSGRDWLRARQAYLRQDQMCRENAGSVLENLRHSLDWPTSRIVLGKETADMHLLLSRDDQERALSAVRKDAGQMADSALRLTVSGLWPPFAFMPDVLSPARTAA